MAGIAPGAITAGRPPAVRTDSISYTQPRWAVKYAVPPSGETETASPTTPPGTSIRMATPVSGLSTTSAPLVVTATISGRPSPVEPVAGDGRSVKGAPTPGRSKLA